MNKSKRTKKLEALINRMLICLDRLGNSQYARIDARLWHDIHKIAATNLNVKLKK